MKNKHYFKTKDERQIFYYDSGTRTPLVIVLIHAFPLDHTMWVNQIEFLEDSHRVIAYDLHGMGESKNDIYQITMEMLSNDLIELLNHLKFEQAIVLGISMGGYVLLRAQEKAPLRFKALILADTQSVADSDEIKIKRSQAIQLIKEHGLDDFADSFLKRALVNEKLIPQIKPIITQNSKTAIIASLLALMSRTDTTESLKKIKIPTLIMTGVKDIITPPEAAFKMHNAIPNSIIKIIENAGHLSCLDNPITFNTTLLEFLLRNNKY